MHKIENEIIHFAWQSNDIMKYMEAETAYFAKTTISELSDTLFDRVVFTEDERPFFEIQIKSVMCMLFSMFQRIAIIDNSSFFIDSTSAIWPESKDIKISGFSVQNRLYKMKGEYINYHRLKLIDEESLKLICKQLIREWYIIINDVRKAEICKTEAIELYNALLINIGYLKLYNDSKSYSQKIKFNV